MITTALTVMMLYSAVFGAALTLLWAAWRLSGLHRHSDFRLSRSLLIGSVLFAAATAALPFIIGRQSVPVQVTVVSRDTVPVQTVAIDAGTAETEIADAEPALSLGDLTAIYAVGLLLSALAMAGSLIYVWSVIGRSRPTPQAGVRLRRNASTVPFSWGHWIVMSEADYATNLRAMLAHERVHRSHAHWLDLLLLRAAECLTWYLPTVRLIRRDLIQCHEYAADAGVLAAGVDAEAYQMMLIERASGRRLRSSLVNSFNFSSIKNRIIMMQRRQSAASAWTRALALLPAAALAIAAVTSPALANAVGNAIPAPATDPLPTAASTPAPVPSTDDTTDEILSVTEVMPEFKGGGTSNLYKYLSENIRYPEDAAQANIQGRVIVQFVVEKDGSVSNAKVYRGVHPSLDAEALRVTNSIPPVSFTPGTMNGKPMRVWFTLPISFKIYSEPAKSEPEPEITPDVEAKYPGGDDAMFQDLSLRIRYPEEAALNDIQGRVTVSFRVNEEGVVNQVKLVKGKHPALDAEAMRVVTTLTGFTPAMKDGKPVASWVTLPLTFRLSGDNEPDPDAYKATPAFYGAISSSARYPREAAEKGITGTTYVYLRIKDNGEPSAAFVKESCWHRMDSSTPQKVNCPDLDHAATDAVNKAARHITTPGLYSIPMTFRLSGLDNVASLFYDNFDKPTMLNEVIVTGSYK